MYSTIAISLHLEDFLDVYGKLDQTKTIGALPAQMIASAHDM